MPKKMPLVSIIIPVYNGSNFLAEAIESALNQTYGNTEILVVNDGSTDGGKTEAIARSFGTTIRYFSKPNGGVASALNYGIKEMRGEYFSWLSHDDVYYPTKIEEQIEFILKNQDANQIVFTDYDLINERSVITGRVRLDHQMLMNKPYYAVLRGCIHGCSLLIPKSCFEKVGLFDEKLRTTQDYDLWFKFLRHYRFIHLPKVLIKSRCHDAQGSRNNPVAITEGNQLWIGFVTNLSQEEMLECEKTCYAFYTKMADFLRHTPYREAESLAERFGREQLSKIKVSVIIPFKNRIQLTIESVKSVLEQTHKNLELLLIDDGSTEDITSLQQYCTTDCRIRLVQQENKGAAAARNLGIDLAQGEYIAFLDSDDLFAPIKLEEQLAYMERNGLGFTHTSYKKRYLDENRPDEFIPSGKFAGNVFPAIMASCPVATPTVMIKRAFLGAHRFPEGIHIGEDVCLWVQLARFGEFGGIDKPLVTVGITRFSSTSDRWKQIRGLKNIIAFYDQDPVLSSQHVELHRLYKALSEYYRPTHVQTGEQPSTCLYKIYLTRTYKIMRKIAGIIKHSFKS